MQNRGAVTALGMWSVALLCGSIVTACSGTIETPTDEFPARTSSRSSAADDDNDTPAATPPRTSTPAAPTNNNPPVASTNNNTPAAPADNTDDPPAAEEPPAAPSGGATLSFASDIQPIFGVKCAPCHGAGGIAGVSIADADIDAALENAKTSEDRVLTKLADGSMPPPCAGGAPGDSGCLSEEEIESIQDWYEAGAPE